MRVVPVLLGLTLLAAGCVLPSPAADVDASASELTVPWWEAVVPNGEAHDHDDPAQHKDLTTPNFATVGYDGLVTDRYGTSTVGMGCGGTGATKEGRKLALVHTIATEVAFIVADVTDPERPVKLGEYLMPNSVIWDATITPDGMHALVGAYPFAFSGRGVVLPKPAGLVDGELVYPFQFYWRDACTGETTKAGPEQYLPFGPGIVMIGLQDPKAPTFEDWVTQPAIGPHSVTAHLIDGKVYATSSVTNLVHDASYYTFFEVVGSKLVPLSVIQAPGRRTGDFGNGHVDASLGKHPITGKVYAWLANWDDGMRIYDMTNMRAPQLVGTWRDGNAGSVHTTFPLTAASGDKHYTIVGQEVGEPEELPTGWVYVIDDTDPTKPTEVGRWTLPFKFPWPDKSGKNFGLGFSPHYVSVVNQTLFVTNYHGGVWAIDISDPTMPQAVGHFSPERTIEKPFDGKSYGPSVEDVVADENGLLTLWDGAGGVYTVTYDATQPMPKAPMWPRPTG